MASQVYQRLRLSFIFWLARRLPTCREIIPVFSQSLDRKLSLREWIVARLHLFVCADCVRYLKQLRFLREAFRFQETLDHASSLTPEARARLKASLRAKAG